MPCMHCRAMLTLRQVNSPAAIPRSTTWRKTGVVAPPHVLHRLLERRLPGPRPGEHGSDLRSGLGQDQDLLIHQRTEHLRRRRLAHGGLAGRQPLQHLLGEDLERGGDQVVLGSEVVVERGLGDIGFSATSSRLMP